MAGTTKLSVEKAIMLGLAKRSLSLGDRSRRNIGNLVLWLKPAVEAIGAFVIGIGISLAA